jgi:hypothetical protein
MKKTFTNLFAFLFVLLLCFSSRAQSGPALSYVTDDYTTLPGGIVSGLSGSYTIEAWVYWRGGAQWQRIFDFGNSTSEYMYLAASGDIVGGDALMTFGIKTSAGPSEQRVQGGVLPLNTWTHVAVVVNDATDNARIYINGVISASTNSMTYRPADLGATANNWLGHSQYSGSPYFDPDFNGVIDEFRISNVLRYAANFTPATTFASDAGTEALYHFDEGSGQVSADATGNNADAILGTTVAVETTDPTWINTATLPVYILLFRAEKGPNGIVLQWKVFSTGEGGQFVIERSTDGINFQPAGTLAIPATQGTFSFDFTDHSYSNGKNYYRLQVAERNAAVKYSPVVSVDGVVNALYSAYPTVTSSQIFVKIPGATTIALYNSSGMLVKKQVLAYAQNIDLTGLASGTYHIRFEGSKETVRFIKL